MTAAVHQHCKSSPEPWIRRIPAHWEEVRARHLFRQRRERARPEDPQLAATQAYGVIPQEEFMEREGQKVVLALSGTAGFSRVHVDDFVISLRSFQGGIEHSAYSGCVTPAYTVLKPSEGTSVPYYRWLLKSGGFVSALNATTEGIREGKTVPYSSFGQIHLPVPPFEEQCRIAAFLDHETARIDELVREQEKLIQLLSEKQQSVMRHAVAKGVDPNVRMRDSGVAWLGEIPENWELVPLKHQCRFVSGGTPSKENPDYWQGDIPWVSAKDMKAFWVSQSIDSITEKAVFESSTNVIDPGALLIVVRSGILQRTIPVGINTIKTAINQDMKALIFDRPETAEYVGYLIQGNETALLRLWRKQGATVESIEQEHLANTLLPAPPVEEASKIVKELRRAINQYENLQLESEQAIRFLNERRSALISAAVTGQLDLRDWQPPESAAVAEVA